MSGKLLQNIIIFGLLCFIASPAFVSYFVTLHDACLFAWLPWPHTAGVPPYLLPNMGKSCDQEFSPRIRSLQESECEDDAFTTHAPVVYGL